MEIQPRKPTVRPQSRGSRATSGSTSSPTARNRPGSASVVHFAPGTRNAWHAHAFGQTLHVTEGIGLMQARGGTVIEIRPGDTIHTPPGEWHWHGATPDHFMAHITIYEAPADGPETEWGDQVSGSASTHTSPGRQDSLPTSVRRTVWCSERSS